MENEDGKRSSEMQKQRGEEHEAGTKGISGGGSCCGAVSKLHALREQRLPLAFSTLGCPGWEWKKILEFAQANGFAAIELRGLMGKMDLPTLLEFSPAQISETKRQVADHGLKISDFGSSSEMHVSDPAERAKQLGDAKRFIDLASALEVPYVRVFGNQIKGPREEVIARVVDGLHQLGEYGGPRAYR